MTLQLIDNAWELKWDTSLDAQISRYLVGNFSSPFVVVNISATNAENVDTRWRKAGSFGQAIELNDDLAYGEVKEVDLNNYFLLEFPLFSGDSYLLYYFPLPRLVEVNLKIWEYKGTTKDTEITKLLDAFKGFQFSILDTQFVQLNAKLDKLLTCCKCSDTLSKKLKNKPYLLYYHKLLWLIKIFRLDQPSHLLTVS